MSKLIEFKASQLNAMTAHIRELDNVRLADTLHAMLGGMGEFFAGEATVIDLTQALKQPDKMDWAGLLSLLRRYGLQPVAIKGLSEALSESARKAGLAVLNADGASTAPAARAAASSSTSSSSASASSTSASSSAAASSNSNKASLHASTSAGGNTMVIDRPVRSGQQIYARSTDLVVIGGVSNGAEIIADGSIHCYGPLRGRALAGAQGNTAARLFCTNFGPELVSIAGVYRTFEGGIPANLAGKPSLAQLRAKEEDGPPSQLVIEPLLLD